MKLRVEKNRKLYKQVNKKIKEIEERKKVIETNVIPLQRINPSLFGKPADNIENTNKKGKSKEQNKTNVVLILINIILLLIIFALVWYILKCVKNL